MKNIGNKRNEAIREALRVGSEELVRDEEFVANVARGVEIFTEKFPLGSTIDTMKVTTQIATVNRIGGGKVGVHFTGNFVGVELAIISTELDPGRAPEIAGAIGFLLGQQLISHGEEL